MKRTLKIDSDAGMALLRTMLLVRTFEEKSVAHYSEGLIRGFLHVYIGEEAVATGICHYLGDDDVIFATYREHGHALARGIEPGRIMAEMFGKQEGVSRGRGGSMHLFDKAQGFMGGSAIVGGGIPLAVGYALGLKKQNKSGVVVVFFGEGAMAEGAFHEALNLAVLWQVPILFVCENNLYAMGTALARSQAQTNLCLRAQSYGVRSQSVDGMDVLAVSEKAGDILNDIRNLREPYFLECKTYRFRAHSMFDPDLYRDKDEILAWKKHDPIDSLIEALKEQNLLTEDQLSALKEEVESKVNAASEFAASGTMESPLDLYKDIYYEENSPMSAPYSSSLAEGETP